MLKYNFDIDKEEFKGKPTGGLRLISSKLLNNNKFKLGFYYTNEDGKTDEISEEVVDSDLTRILIEEELIETLKLVINAQDNFLSASLEEAEKNLEELKNKKDITGILGWAGIFCCIPLTRGLQKLKNGDPDALNYILPSLIGLIVSTIIYKRHTNHLLSYRKSKQEYKDRITEEGFKIVRKK